MRRAHLRKLKRVRLRASNFLDRVTFARRPAQQWLRSAFGDLVAENRAEMLAAIAVHTRNAMRLEGRPLVRALLDGAQQIDDGSIHVAGQPLRSYVDISVQVRIVRAMIEYLSNDPLHLASLILEHEPDSRTGLLVMAELLLDRGESERAVEHIRRALRVQAVCQTAQQLLERAQPQDYDLSRRFCHMPFTHMSTGFRGETFACACPAWVPYSIGNITEAESPDAIWNSEAAQEIRRSILDGDYRYCSRTQCSMITARKLPLKEEVTTPALRRYIDERVTRLGEAPLMFELNHEPTCNLACPSCRSEIVSAKADEIDLYDGASKKVILPMLRRVQGHTYITGGGEAFASKHFRSILRTLNRAEYPGLRVYLITNGLLMTPHRWQEFPNLPEMIGVLSVSVDAARAETYEQLRRPGKWAVLMKNLEYLSGMRRSNRIASLQMNFVVQQANFREIPAFIDLADSLSADSIWFQRVVNYGAYDEATFARTDVASPSHPEHQELLSILRMPAFDRKTINWHMLMSIVPERVASAEKLEFLY